MLHIARAGIVATGAGMFVGMVLVFFAVRVLRSQLYGVSLYDPLTLAAAPLLLAVIAVTASFVRRCALHKLIQRKRCGPSSKGSSSNWVMLRVKEEVYW